MHVELFQSTFKVEPTTYFGDSFINGAPGSSSAVLADHAGANISNVRRPRSSALQLPIASAMAVPIVGSNPKSKVQVGASITPSSVVNSCTTMLPMSNP